MQADLKNSGRAAAWLGAAIGAQALVSLAWMLLEVRRAALNPSFTFFIAAGLLGAIALILLYMAFRSYKSNRFSDRIERALVWLRDKFYPWGLAAVLALFIAFTSFLVLRLSDQDPLMNALAPVFNSFFFLVILDLLVIYILRVRKAHLPSGDRLLRYLLLGLAVVWALVALSRVGLDPDTQLWNVAGVPVLLNQVAAILLGAILGEQALASLARRLPTQSALRKGLLLLTCLLIWAASVFLWLRAPIAQTVFVEGPWLPNADYIPHSDAATIDLGAQYMLIGEGLEKTLFTEKPLYTFFLGILHALTNGSYLALTRAQIMVLALLPVLLYLMGRKLGGEFLGIAAAGFGMVKEFNAIFGMWQISVSNSRLLMSELPLTVLIVAMAYFLFKWFKNPEKPGSAPLLAGSLLGFASLVRANPLLLVLLIPLFSLGAYRGNLKSLRKPLLLFLLGLLLTAGPWFAYTQIRYGDNPAWYKIDSVIRTRITHQPQRMAPTGMHIEAPLLFANHKDDIGEDYQDPQAPENPDAPAPQDNQQNLPLVAAENPATPDEVPAPALPDPVTLKVFLGHFLNNQIKALFIMPFQVYPLELEPVLDLPYWEEPITWRGALPFGHALAFAANLLLILLGLSGAWKKWPWAGLVPLLVNLGYYAANAIGRTSGSRYLLPADWTLWLYWLMGIHSLLQVLHPQIAAAPSPQHYPRPASNSSNTPRLWLNSLLLLTLGAAIPLGNLAFPQQYRQEDKAAAFQRLPLDLIYDDIELTPERVVHLFEKPGSNVVYGKMLYLRYGHNWMTGKRGYMFEVLSPAFTEVFVPTDEPPEGPMPYGLDVVAIGCQRDGYLEAYLAYIPSQNQLLHLGFKWEDSLCD